MRRLGCFTVTLLLVALGLFVADLAVTRFAEQRIADDVSQTLDADTEVALERWPVSVRLLNGTIPTARATATDVPLDNGATLDRLDVELTNVEINVSDLRRRTNRLPPAEEGTFSATLGEDALAAVLGIPAGVVNVMLQDGVVRLEAAGVNVEADVGARDGQVIVSLRGALGQVLGAQELPIDLSDEPGAPAVQEITIDDGVMVVRGTLEEVQR